MCTYLALKTHQIISFVFKYCTWKLKNLVSSRISSNFISKHGAFNWWRQGFDKFGQKWLNCLANDTRTLSRKRKNRLLDDLIRKPDKTISAARTSAIVVVLALRKHMKTLRSVFAYKRSTSDCENFTGHSGFTKTYWTTSFALKQLIILLSVSNKHFFTRVSLNADVLRYFAYVRSTLFVCICLEFLKQNK